MVHWFIISLIRLAVPRFSFGCSITSNPISRLLLPNLNRNRPKIHDISTVYGKSQLEVVESYLVGGFNPEVISGTSTKGFTQVSLTEKHAPPSIQGGAISRARGRQLRGDQGGGLLQRLLEGGRAMEEIHGENDDMGYP